MVEVAVQAGACRPVDATTFVRPTVGRRRADGPPWRPCHWARALSHRRDAPVNATGAQSERSLSATPSLVVTRRSRADSAPSTSFRRSNWACTAFTLSLASPIPAAQCRLPKCRRYALTTGTRVRLASSIATLPSLHNIQELKKPRLQYEIVSFFIKQGIDILNEFDGDFRLFLILCLIGRAMLQRDDADSTPPGRSPREPTPGPQRVRHLGRERHPERNRAPQARRSRKARVG